MIIYIGRKGNYKYVCMCMQALGERELERMRMGIKEGISSGKKHKGAQWRIKKNAKNY